MSGRRSLLVAFIYPLPLYLAACVCVCVRVCLACRQRDPNFRLNSRFARTVASVVNRFAAQKSVARSIHHKTVR
uniref:Putative secreted protein n=1 Tax=Anopheles darlingi TaxID=43151 RepID=A0A2M4DEC2_ANODA